MNTDQTLREAFHYSFLDRLLRISDPKLYVLKGGVNLRFFFHSPRYSEDMDLDVLGGSVSTLTKNGFKILNDASFQRGLRTIGIESLEINNPEKAKQTPTTQRFRLRLVTPAGERLPTKIEFSRRKNSVKEVSMDYIDAEIARRCRKVPFQCQHYPGNVAIVQKIEALAGRTVTQARDVFDIGILHTSGYALSRKLHTALSKQVTQQARENLLTLTFEDYSNQVLEFIAAEDRTPYAGPRYWAELQEIVLRVLHDGS